MACVKAVWWHRRDLVCMAMRSYIQYIGPLIRVC